MINTFTGSLLLLWWINPPVRRQIKSASLNQTKITIRKISLFPYHMLATSYIKQCKNGIKYF